MEKSDSEKHLTLFTKRFFSGTLLSRISGLGRDLAMAFAFGDHPSVAAFMVAFRLSHLFRRLLGEGPLQSAFIPQFEGLKLQNPQKAAFFFRKVVILITFFLLTLTLFSEIGIQYLLPYFSVSGQEILRLTAYLLPGLLFICLYGINIALLNCHDSFFIPSVAPAVCNILWIAAALYLKNFEKTLAMQHLAKWVVFGLLGQWLLTFPLTIKYGGWFWKEIFSFQIPPEVKNLIKSFSLGAIGVGALQFNAFADALFARFADLRGPVYLWYSIRLEQLALALFGIACVNVIAPRLSRAIKNDDTKRSETLFALSYERIMVILIPCTFAFLALGSTGVNLIYGRGNFSSIAVQKTTFCLWAYGFGLIPAILVILYSAVFYAKDNFKAPMQISLFCVFLNLLLNYSFVFIFQLGAISIALATSISSWINALILFKMNQRNGLNAQFSRNRIFNLVNASLFASVFTFSLDYFLGDAINSREIVIQFTTFFLKLCCFSLSFFIYGFLFKNRDILNLSKFFSSSIGAESSM